MPSLFLSCGSPQFLPGDFHVLDKLPIFDTFFQFILCTFLHSMDADITPNLIHGFHGHPGTLWSQDSINQACQHQRGVPDIISPALAFSSTQVKVILCFLQAFSYNLILQGGKKSHLYIPRHFVFLSKISTVVAKLF